MTLRSRAVSSLTLVLSVGLLLASIWAVHSAREITVVIDGEPTTITTLRDTVDEILAELGVALDEDDWLSAAPDATVLDGATVELVRARLVSVTIDGDLRTLRAPVMTVADVLDELDLPHPPAELWLSHAMTAAVTGEIVRIRLPRDVTIAVDGETLEVTTNVLSVADVLAEVGVEVGPDDLVAPALDADLDDGTQIVINRVEQETITVDEAIPYETVWRETDELYRGDSRVVQEGVEGVRRVTYRVTRVDGEETERERLDSEVISEPTTRIIEEGTRDHPPGVNGRDEGLASWYGCGDGFDGRTTANGETFDDQAMTAAHRTLPFDTIVTVESHETGRSIQVRINDRGPAAWTGKIIDLSCAAMQELAGGLDGSHPVTITW